MYIAKYYLLEKSLEGVKDLFSRDCIGRFGDRINDFCCQLVCGDRGDTVDVKINLLLGEGSDIKVRGYLMIVVQENRQKRVEHKVIRHVVRR